LKLAAWPREEIMNANPMDRTLRALGIGSIIFGFVGGAMFWWLPMGMMLSMTGLVLGLVDCLNARRRSWDYRLSLAGLLISAAALVLCIVVAALGMQTVTFGW
jgi:hypothetical protein